MLLEESWPKSPDLPAAATSTTSASELPLAQSYSKPADLAGASVPSASSSTSSPLASQPSPRSVKPSDLDDAMDCNADELGPSNPHQLTEERVSQLGDVMPRLNSGPTSRRSSLSSSLTDILAMEVDNPSSTGLQSGVESEDSDVGEEEWDAGSDRDEKKNGSTDLALAAQLTEVGLRRSSHNRQSPQAVAPLALSTIVVQRKPIVKKKDLIPVLVSLLNNAIFIS